MEIKIYESVTSQQNYFKPTAKLCGFPFCVCFDTDQ